MRLFKGIIILLLGLMTADCSKQDDKNQSATKTPAPTTTPAPVAKEATPPTAPAPLANQATASPHQTPAPVAKEATPPTAPAPLANQAAASPPPVPNHPPISQDAAPSKPLSIPQSGKVIDSKQAGSYTYVLVEAEGSQYWLATNQFEPHVGEVVHWGQFSVMKNFYSKNLNQTFPMVVFVSAILPGPVAPPPPPNKGKVFSVIQSGGYTYIQVNNETGPWLAVPTTQMKEGDAVTWAQGTLMKNFNSKALNRTFEEILFLGSVQVE